MMETAQAQANAMMAMARVPKEKLAGEGKDRSGNAARAKQATELCVRRDWILVKMLADQREGAEKFFENVKETVTEADLLQCPEAPAVWTKQDNSLVVFRHVNAMALTGTPDSFGFQQKFLAEEIQGCHSAGQQDQCPDERNREEGHIDPDLSEQQYLEGLVKRVGGVESRRNHGDIDLDETPVRSKKDGKLYKKGVGTLLYIAWDRPDFPCLVKELASNLQKPTQGAMNTLKD
eukprot:s3272_g14.t1